MPDHIDFSKIRLVNFSLPVKLTLMLFLLLIGAGYLVALGNIYFQNSDADLEPGLSPNDLRRRFHGLSKEVTADAVSMKTSKMLEMVRPGGKMREKLEKGDEPSIRALTSWLQDGAQQETFGKAAVYHTGDPSAKAVIKQICIACHNADGGDMEDVPYAANDSAEPEYALVAKVAVPQAGVGQVGQRLDLAPTGVPELIHITHAHIFTIPMFALIVAGLFFLTGFSQRVKLFVGPVPMLAVCLELSSWWLARPFEPFVYIIAASGALFGLFLGIQLVCVSLSMWFGKRA